MKKIFIFIIIILVAVAILYYRYNDAINSPYEGETIRFSIETGEGAKRITEKLALAGAIKNQDFFYYYLRSNGLIAGLKAGDYDIVRGMTGREIAQILTQGKVANREREIKIIEGWRIREIDLYLVSLGYEEGAFARLAEDKGNFAEDGITFLSDLPDGSPLEGYFFPDTYRVYADADVHEIAARMLKEFDRKLSPAMREEIRRQGKGLNEVVTLASILEKEVKSSQDRKLVAGILYNRLEIGMGLEVDSTINYITGRSDPQARGQDLAIDSPYNTYKYRGLPPGPISNPGISAIEAAVYPTDNDYLFFLNRLDTGETIFSKTYEEHLRNKAKYLD